MSVIYIVLPLALVVIGAAVAAYLWAVKSGQFDDVTTPALRALQEDGPPARSADSDPPPLPASDEPRRSS